MIWELEYPARPWLVNQERAGGQRGIGGRHGRSKLNREWRDAFARLCIIENVPALRSLTVEAYPICRDRRRPDVGNVYPAVKAAIDGLVDAGVVPDDNDLYVRTLTVSPARIEGYAALRLIVTGEPCSREERDARARAYRQKLIDKYVS